MATTSTSSACRSRSALRTWRPIRPKPLMPTRTATCGLPSVSANSERLAAGVARRGAELLFDAQQLVVLVDALATRGRTGLDLAGVSANRQIGNGGVLGF